MKVVLVNGSRRENGCTFTALNIVAKVLNENGIDTQLIQVGKRVMEGAVDDAVDEAGILFEEHAEDEAHRDAGADVREKGRRLEELACPQQAGVQHGCDQEISHRQY